MSVAAYSRKCHLTIASRQPHSQLDEKEWFSPFDPCSHWPCLFLQRQRRIMRYVERRHENADHAEGRLRLYRELLLGGNSSIMRQMPDIFGNRDLDCDTFTDAAESRRDQGRTTYDRASSAARTAPSRDNVTTALQHHTFNISIRENHHGSEVHCLCIGFYARAARLLRAGTSLMLRTGAGVLQRRRLLHVGSAQLRLRPPPARAGGGFLLSGARP